MFFIASASAPENFAQAPLFGDQNRRTPIPGAEREIDTYYIFYFYFIYLSIFFYFVIVFYHKVKRAFP